MRRRGWAAWCISALLHALLAGLLLWRVATPKAPDRAWPAPIEIEITEVPRTAPALRPIVRTPDRSFPARSPRIATGGDRRGDPVSGPAPSLANRERAPAPEPPLLGGPAGSTPELSLRALSPDVQARLAGSPPHDGPTARSGRPSVDDLRAERERQEDAVANVAAGRADPLLYDYLRGARVRFEDDARRIAEAIPIGAGQALRGWGRGLMQRVADLHKGDRVADQVQPDLRDEAEKRRPDLAAAYDENRRQAEAGAEIRRAEICLDIAPGRDTTTTLRHGSGNAALDRVVLEAFARSVSVHEVPPDARARRACYEVRTATYRVGPAPGVSCDLNLFGPHGPSCVWPMKKVTSVTSQLLSVEYPAKPGAPASKSLLRGAR